MLIMRSAISAAGKRGQSGSLAGLRSQACQVDAAALKVERTDGRAGAAIAGSMRDDLRRRPSGSRRHSSRGGSTQWRRGLDAQDGVFRLNRADFGEWIYSFIDLLSTLGGEKMVLNIIVTNHNFVTVRK